jgi:predicted DNA-binding transcriptional regulator AlpA
VSPYLSSAGVAKILGVSSARVRQLAARDDFPRPAVLVEPGGQRLWRPSDIERWAREADRSPGRPRSES